MWKLIALLLIASFGASRSQNVLTCEYIITIYNEYGCLLVGIEATDPNEAIVFAGDHLGDRSDEDVEVVHIRTSNTPFMIPEIFTTFPNMFELDIQNSNLESINIPDTVSLVWLILYRNNISRIDNDSIRGQTELYYAELMYNGIEVIEEEAFRDFGGVNTLVLIGNNIAEIIGTTLHPLTSAVYIDFERNQLTSIGPETFLMNTNAYAIYCEFNQINSIHPQFAVGIRYTLRFINFAGNQCVDQSFPLQDGTGWIIMHNALQTCFNNFEGTVPEEREVTMRFVGNIVFQDENGNVIGRI